MPYHLVWLMDAYAKAGERKVGADRPWIEHVTPETAKQRGRAERQAEKERVAAARRAIKKSARQNLKQQLERELQDAQDHLAIRTATAMDPRLKPLG